MSGDRLLLDTDAIIAATALVNDCILVSADAHFRKLVRVPLQTYPL